MICIHIWSLFILILQFYWALLLFSHEGWNWEKKRLESCWRNTLIVFKHLLCLIDTCKKRSSCPVIQLTASRSRTLSSTTSFSRSCSRAVSVPLIDINESQLWTFSLTYQTLTLIGSTSRNSWIEAFKRTIRSGLQKYNKDGVLSPEERYQRATVPLRPMQRHRSMFLSLITLTIFFLGFLKRTLIHSSCCKPSCWWTAHFKPV